MNDGRLLRVARSVDGRLRQRYFSLIGVPRRGQREVRKQARALDEKWEQDQLRAKQRRIRAAVTPRRHSTGVRGINLIYRPSPAFRVQVQAGGQSYVREFSVTHLGAEKAWRSAARYLAQCRGYKRAPRAWTAHVPRVPKRPPKRRR